MGNCYDGMRVGLDQRLLNGEQREVGTDYVQVSKHLYIAASQCREEWVVANDAMYHPRGVRYRAPAAARAVAHAVEHPGCVVSGFSALALYGLPYLVDGADVTLLGVTSKNQVANELAPAIRRPSRSPLAVWTLEHRGLSFRASDPMTALIQALVQLKRGEHRWKTASVAGLKPVDVMAAQLIDSARRFLRLEPTQIRLAAQNKISSRWVDKVVKLSSPLADSPKETEMRLLLAAVASEFGCTFTEQVPLYDEEGAIVTVFDFAVVDLKIAVMYDGEHHWDHAQRQKDAAINLKATRHGWTVARCSSGIMADCLGLVADLICQKVHGDGGSR